MKRSFFQAAVTSILLYGCTTWTLTKRLEKKLDGNYTRMLRAILNKSWRQHPTRHQLYGHLSSITKTIQVRQTRHAGHCWRSRDELIRDVLLWTPTHGRAKAGRPARTYIQQLCEDTGCCPEYLLTAMNDREEWRERVRDIYQRDMMMMTLLNLCCLGLLSRADVNDNVKLILGIPFANSCLFNVHLTLETMIESQFCVLVGCDRFRKSVSGCIDPSALSLFLLRCSFSLALSPSFRLSPSPSGSRLPSLSCNKFVRRRTQNKSSLPAVTMRILCSWDLARICIRANYPSLVRDLPSSNMLEAAILVSLFRSTSQTRSCALRMPRYVAFITFPGSFMSFCLQRVLNFSQFALFSTEGIYYHEKVVIFW